MRYREGTHNPKQTVHEGENISHLAAEDSWSSSFHPPGLTRTTELSNLIGLTHLSAFNTLCSILLHVQIMWHSQRDELAAITGSTGMECMRFSQEA